METDFQKQYDENKERILDAILVLIGSTDKSEARQIFKENNLLSKTPYDRRISEKEVQMIIASLIYTLFKRPSNLFKITGQNDDRTCPDCKRWQGKIVAMYDDGKHATIADFINEHGFHINCRCSLQAI